MPVHNRAATDFASVMAELESLGTEQNRKTYARHGVQGKAFGVSYANLYALQKRIRLDDDLAEQLWATDNHDARVLATLIHDPKTLTFDLVAKWVAESSDYVTVGAVARLACQSPAAHEIASAWRDDPDEWRGMLAWTVLAVLAERDLDEAAALDLIDRIEREIHTRPNRVRYSMNGALISIGARSEGLKQRALEAADRIGVVEVDHGDTCCKTPDARHMIEKTFAHRHRKGKRA